MKDMPPEVRLMIWAMALNSPFPFDAKCHYQPDMSHAHARSLLAALRPSNKLYQEALEIFYKVNHFELSASTYVIFDDLRAEVLQYLRSAVLCIE
jgi:hypothetical protein